jgi:BirA family transcriptional regulator, biotin operon repressor / biotin---[acetyl-CoA-carboxylase] ligase
MVKTYHFDEIDSTNKEAHRIVKQFPPSTLILKQGIVITADRQSAGQGRENRTWYSTEGGLYYTLLFKPRTLTLEDLSDMSLKVAKKMQTLVFEQSGVMPTLKWPNDLFLNGRKLAGILIDCLSPASQTSPEVMVIGIGINLNQSIFPDPVSTIETSLFIETGQHYSKQTFISEITTSLLDWLGEHD